MDWLRLYLAKLGETLLHSSWMVALMALPILAAYGVIYRGGVLFIPYALIVVAPLLLLPAVVGTAVTLILVNVFPARRTRDLLSSAHAGPAVDYRDRRGGRRDHAVPHHPARAAGAARGLP